MTPTESLRMLADAVAACQASGVRVRVELLPVASEQRTPMTNAERQRLRRALAKGASLDSGCHDERSLLNGERDTSGIGPSGGTSQGGKVRDAESPEKKPDSALASTSQVSSSGGAPLEMSRHGVPERDVTHPDLVRIGPPAGRAPRRGPLWHFVPGEWAA